MIESILAKEITSNKQLVKSIELFSNHVDHDTSSPCYVMVTDSEIVTCNRDHVNSWREAGYTVFGIAHSESDLQKIIRTAEN